MPKKGKSAKLKTPLYTSGKPVGQVAGPTSGPTPADPLGYLKGK